MPDKATVVATVKATIHNDVIWKGVVYTCNTKDMFNADGNLVKHPVPTVVDVPPDLAKALEASPFISDQEVLKVDAANQSK